MHFYCWLGWVGCCVLGSNVHRRASALTRLVHFDSCFAMYRNFDREDPPIIWLNISKNVDQSNRCGFCDFKFNLCNSETHPAEWKWLIGWGIQVKSRDWWKSFSCKLERAFDCPPLPSSFIHPQLVLSFQIIWKLSQIMIPRGGEKSNENASAQ